MYLIAITACYHTRMSKVGIEFASNPLYRAPAYLQLATKKKCNRNDIFVLGVPGRELHTFWQNVSYHALSFTRPVEEGRAVVDIDCRCHKNTANVEDLEASKSSTLAVFLWHLPLKRNQLIGLMNLKLRAQKVEEQQKPNRISCNLAQVQLKGLILISRLQGQASLMWLHQALA